MQLHQTLKYPIIVDKEKMTIQAGDLLLKTPLDLKKSGNTPVCISFAKMVLGGKYSGIHGSNKSVAQQLNTEMDCPPRIYYGLFLAQMLDLYEGENKSLVRSYCYSKRKLDPKKYKLFSAALPLIKQAIQDGQDNLVPLIMYTGKSPQELKLLYGKSLWKSLTRNSKTRNHSICKVRKGLCKRTATTLQKLSSSFISNHVTQYSSPVDSPVAESNFLWLQKHLRENKKLSTTTYSKYSSRVLDTYLDTKRMATQVGATFNEAWTYPQIQEKHEEYKNLIQEQRYTKTPWKHLGSYPKSIQGDNYTAKLIESPYELQQEGQEMKHCVSAYSQSVGEGDYLVYSILDEEGKRISTLGLQRGVTVGRIKTGDINSPWGVQQHYGKCNQRVTDEKVLKLAKGVVTKINKENPSGKS